MDEEELEILQAYTAMLMSSRSKKPAKEDPDEELVAMSDGDPDRFNELQEAADPKNWPVRYGRPRDF